MKPIQAVVLSSAILLAPSFLAAASAQGIDVYCHGAEEIAEEVRAYFCKQLGKEGTREKAFELVDERELGQVEVELKGIDAFSSHGRATVLTKPDEWSPEQSSMRAEAILRVGETTKTFTGEGTIYQATAEVVQAIDRWIRNNKDAVRKK
jgi:hypothetical protein